MRIRASRLGSVGDPAMSDLEFQRALTPDQMREALSLLDGAARAKLRNVRVGDLNPAEEVGPGADHASTTTAPPNRLLAAEDAASALPNKTPGNCSEKIEKLGPAEWARRSIPEAFRARDRSGDGLLAPSKPARSSAAMTTRPESAGSALMPPRRRPAPADRSARRGRGRGAEWAGHPPASPPGTARSPRAH